MKAEIAKLKAMIKEKDVNAMEYLSELAAKCITDDDKAELQQLTDDLLKEATHTITEVEQDVETYTLREKLGDLAEVINFAYVSRAYFGKSRTWLYQRINGNLVNGKRAEFSSAEKKIFITALNEIGAKLAQLSAQ